MDAHKHVWLFFEFFQFTCAYTNRNAQTRQSCFLPFILGSGLFGGCQPCAAGVARAGWLWILGIKYVHRHRFIIFIVIISLIIIVVGAAYCLVKFWNRVVFVVFLRLILFPPLFFLLFVLGYCFAVVFCSKPTHKLSFLVVGSWFVWLHGFKIPVQPPLCMFFSSFPFQ